MSKIKKNTQRNKTITLVPSVIYSMADFDSTYPNIVQIRNYNLVDTVYMSDRSNVSTTSQQNIVLGSTKVFTFPKGVNALYFLSNSACQIEVITYEADEISTSDLDNTQTSVIVNSTVTSSVAVTSLPALSTGANTIGNVGINGSVGVTNTGIGTITDTQSTDATSSWSLISLLKGIWTKLGALTISGALPTGANTIGNVTINTGANTIGAVTNLGIGGIADSQATDSVSSWSVVALLKGLLNKIGAVDSTVLPTIYNVTMTTANTEYSQALPANTKKVNFSVQGGDNTFNFRYAFVTGKVATPTAPFKQYNGDIEFTADNMLIASGTIYFGCSVASKVMQIECWT